MSGEDELTDPGEACPHACRRGEGTTGVVNLVDAERRDVDAERASALGFGAELPFIDDILREGLMGPVTGIIDEVAILVGDGSGAGERDERMGVFGEADVEAGCAGGATVEMLTRLRFVSVLLASVEDGLSTNCSDAERVGAKAGD